MSDIVEDAKELETIFDDITKAINDANTQSRSFRQTMLDLSSTGRAAGQAWTVISRLTSGTGFWRVQNRIRAISNFFKFQELAAQQAAEEEEKAIKRLAEANKGAKDLKKAKDLLEKVENNIATTAERQLLFNTEQFQFLDKMYGRKEALAIMEERITKAQENNKLLDKDMLQTRVREHTKMLEKGLSYSQIFFGTDKNGTDVQYRRFKKMTEEQKATYVQYKMGIEQIRAAQEDLTVATEEQVPILEKIAYYEDWVNLMRRQGIDEEELKTKEAYKNLQIQKELNAEKQKEIDEFQQNFDDAQSTITTSRQSLKKDKIFVGTDASGDAEIKSDVQGQLRKRILSKGAKILDAIPGGSAIMFVFKGVKKFFKNNTSWADKRKAIGNAIKPAMRLLTTFLRGWLVWGALLIFALITLKETGFLDLIIEIVRGFVIYFMNIWTGVVEFIGAVGAYFGELINFIGVLFNGDSGEIWAAAGSLLLATWDVMWAAIQLLFADILWGLVVAFFSGIIAYYFGEGKNIVEGIIRLITDIGIMILAVKAFLFLLPISLPLAIVGGLTLLLTGGWLRDAAIDVMKGVIDFGGGMATGGRVGRNASYLVGEKGPEIVNLKAGDYVTPNNKIGGVTNNISVHVNGRVGASDAELNDLANKLSSKIMMQMQRSGSSGVYR